MRFITLFLLFQLYSSNSSAQLIPDFTADPVAGCAPLVVTFNDASSGSPTSYMWDLGNGATSTLRNPSTTYFTPGNYTIKLTIKNSLGSDSIVKAQYITVYPKSVPNFAGSPTSGCFPLKTQFTDQTIAGSSSIVKWEWDFGDGVLSTLQNPSHIYTTLGNFNVSLRVTNSNGCVTSVTNSSYIRIGSGAKAQFSSSASNSCSAPATVNFVNNSTGVGSLSYKWDFGDSSTSTLPNPSHVYKNSGSFTVKLITTNSYGCTDTSIKNNFVIIGTTKADFTFPSAICEGTPFTLTNTSTPAPGSAIWNFGDGTTSTELNPSKIYNKAGKFTIMMVANFGACKDSASKEVIITAKPTVDFSAAPLVGCKAPLTVNFTNATTDATQFLWNFGDKSSTSTEQNPSHTYLAEGIDTVSLTVTNSAGCKATKIVPGMIKIKKPDITLEGLPAGGCAPFSKTFNALVKSNDVITNYIWSFGDGTTSNSASPTHVYNNPGVYPVTLTYTIAAGCTDSIRIDRGIVIGTKPKASLSADALSSCASQTINFQDQSTGNPNEWFWSFGDGSSSSVQNPKHQYGDTGSFTITLIALNNGCPDTLIIPRYILIKAPIANFTFSKNCSAPGNFAFTDKSINADTWAWNFGDGSTSTLQNPTHSYSSAGTYAVSLTVTNNNTGCSNIKTSNLKVITETAGFINNLDACKNSPVTFTGQNINRPNIALYTWKFGDGNVDTSSTDTIKHSYINTGGYDVTLIIKDIDGCVDSITKPLAVKVEGPTAFFRSTVPAVCLSSPVTFFDSSYGVNPISQWNWNWGDGTSQNFTSGPFSHKYDSAGKYTVTLTVTDNKGCSSTLQKSNEIIISQPSANFSADTLSCTTSAVNFYNYSSTNNGSAYTWNFGDNSPVSSDANPVHLYPTEGIYTIKLTITDIYGCTASEIKSNYVKIGNPVADFSISDSISNCPPLIVNTTNKSVNYSTWKWDFGDGTTAAVQNPSHFYSEVGTFDLVLTISSSGTCTSTKTKKITIDGPQGTFSYTNIEGCNPLKTQFSVETGKGISYIWDFNDGNTIKTNSAQVSHVYTTTGHYVPKIILRNSDGCSVPIVGKDTIKVLGVKASFDHSEELLCDFGTVQFTNTSTTNDPIINFAWNFADGSTSSQENPSHGYQQPGTYNTSLIVTTSKGCKDTVKNSFPVKINVSPKISIDANAGACVEADFLFAGILSNPDTSSVSWQWDFANGSSSSVQNPPVQNYQTSGLYTVNLIGYKSNGCSDTVQKTVEIYSLPDLTVSPDKAICVGQTATLDVSGAETYSWSPSTSLSCNNCASTQSTPNSSISYLVKGTSSKGCVSIDSVKVIVKLPFKVSVSRPDSLCFGNSVQLNASGSEEYTWSPTGGLNNPSISSPLASPTTTTTYQVIASDSIGCFKDTGYVLISVFPIPTVNAGEDQTINVGRQTDIIPQISDDVTSILWTPTKGIIANNYPGITVKPTETIEYSIEVKNQGGCIATDQVTVHVLCNNANIFIPNTFSPNGDGANDVFYPRGSGLFKIKNFKIFNRWGEIVYERSQINANDVSAGWDGTFKGVKLSPDVFVYMVEVVCDNNQSIIFKGNISLLR